MKVSNQPINSSVKAQQNSQTVGQSSGAQISKTPHQVKQPPMSMGIDEDLPLQINQCMSRSVQTQSEILYSAIWLKNVEHVKYAYLYN
jgi:hypothetical protein